MTTKKLMTGLTLIAVLSAFTAIGNAAPTPSPKEINWVSLSQVLNNAEAAGFHGVESAHRKHGQYVVRATTADGIDTKLVFNGETGELTHQQPLLDKKQAHDGQQKYRQQHQKQHRKPCTQSPTAEQK